MTTAQTTARVAIVIRTRDRPDLLDRALGDIAAQSFADWHVVIVNDGGDADAVASVVAERAESLAGRVSVIDNPTSLGRWPAANQGVRAVDAEFVVLHDDDDFWDPEFLATTTRWLDGHPDDSGVMVTTEIVYEHERAGKLVETHRAIFWDGIQEVTYFDMLRINRAVPISYLYRRSLHDEVGYYNESLEVVGDWEFNLRVMLDHHIGFIAGAPLAFWTQRLAATGALGNSVNAGAALHVKYDRRVRDEALREYARTYGPGALLYLTKIMEADHAELEADLERRIARVYENASLLHLIANDLRRIPRWWAVKRNRRDSSDG